MLQNDVSSKCRSMRLRLEGHLSMRVSETQLAPKLMHMLLISARSVVITREACGFFQVLWHGSTSMDLQRNLLSWFKVVNNLCRAQRHAINLFAVNS